MPRKVAIAMTLAMLGCCAACSSSSGGGGDASIVDVVTPEEEADSTAADASDEEDANSSPVYGCSEAQLAYATNMACGQCVTQNCAALLKACTNCVSCEMQLGTGCPMCSATCFSRGMVAPAFDAGP